MSPNAVVSNPPELVQDPAPPMSMPGLLRGISLDIGNEPASAAAPIGFEIKGILGEGGMGIVYQAIQEYPQRLVALKVLKFTGPQNEVLHRFKREVAILAKLNHRGIPALFSAGTLQSGVGTHVPFMAMELLHGTPIDQFCLQKGLNSRERVELFLKLCRIVEAVHGAGVIHRDLTSRNVLVEECGEPRVLDFGLAGFGEATIADSGIITINAQPFGTFNYMSPEQAAGRTSEVDARSDVYALGVILYKMLRGQYPISCEGKNVVEAARRVQQLEPARLDVAGIGRDVEVIVQKALRKGREERYQSVAAFAEDLSRYLEHRPILARPASRATRASKFVRRHRRGVFASAVAVVLSISTVAGVSIAYSQHAKNATLRHVAQERSAESDKSKADSLFEQGRYQEARTAYNEVWDAYTRLGIDPMPLAIGLWKLDRVAARPVRAVEGESAFRGSFSISADEKVFATLKSNGELTVRKVTDNATIFRATIGQEQRRVALSADGRTAVVFGDDSLRVIDLEKEATVGELADIPFKLQAVAVGEKRIAIISRRGDVLLCDLQLSKQGKIDLAGQRAADCCVAPDDSLVILDSQDTIWKQAGNASKAEVLGQLPRRSISDRRRSLISPDGKCLAVVGGEATELFNLSALNESPRLINHGTRELCFFAGTGQLCFQPAVGGNLDVVGISDGKVLQIPVSGVTGASFSDHFALVLDGGGLLRLFGIDRDQGISRFGEVFGKPIASAMSRDGAIAAMATRGGDVKIIDLRSGTVLQSISVGADARQLELTETGDQVAIKAGGRVCIADAHTGQILCDFSPDKVVKRISFSKDGSVLAAVPGSAPAVCFWMHEEQSWKRVDVPLSDSPACIALSPDGRRALISGLAGGVQMWCISQGAPTYCFTVPESEDVTMAIFSEDGKRVIERDAHKHLVVTNSADGSPQYKLSIGTPVNAIASQGERLAISSANRITLFDLSNGSETGRFTVADNYISLAGIARNGMQIAAASGSRSGIAMIDLSRPVQLKNAAARVDEEGNGAPWTNSDLAVSSSSK